MAHALFLWRSMLALAARVSAVVALVAVFAASAPAQSIDLKLNVFYEIEGDALSGGTWELVGRTDSLGGIVGVNARLQNINSGSVIYHGPRGIVNGTDNAGFWLNSNSAIVGQPTARKVGSSQSIIFSLPPGDEQTAFYGVGKLANGTPGALGPSFTTLTNPQNIPWATPALGDEEWPTAALFFSGTFADGVTPSFFTGEASTGQVFTSVPANNQTFGTIVDATIETFVDTSPGGGGTLDGDHNGDGAVNILDYVVWRMDPGTFGDQAGYDAWAGNFGATGGNGSLNGDHNEDGAVNSLDYAVWRADPASHGGQAGYDAWATNYGDSNGSGSGSIAEGSAVPEPAAGALLILGSLLAISGRTASRVARNSPWRGVPAPGKWAKPRQNSEE